MDITLAKASMTRKSRKGMPKKTAVFLMLPFFWSPSPSRRQPPFEEIFSCISQGISLSRQPTVQRSLKLLVNVSDIHSSCFSTFRSGIYKSKGHEPDYIKKQFKLFIIPAIL